MMLDDCQWRKVVNNIICSEQTVDLLYLLWLAHGIAVFSLHCGSAQGDTKQYESRT